MHGAPPHDPDDSLGAAHEFLVVCAIDRFDGLIQLAGMASADSLIVGLREDLSCLLGAGVRVEARGNYCEAVLTGRSAASLAPELAALADALRRTVEIDGYRFERVVSLGATDIGSGVRAVDAQGAAQWALAQARIAQQPVILPNSRTRSVAEDRLELMRKLQRAIREDRLDLHYQPKLHARQSGIAAAEGLIRWTCPEAGPIAPDRFISIAEATGDIRWLTHWVIGRALRDLETLSQRGAALRLDINVSGTLLSDRRFTREVIDRLAPAAGMIGIEITETAMITDPDRALANLRLCAEAGLRLAIDDYGAGFSSLAYLQQLPLSELKIDKSFVLRLASGQRDPLLVRSTIDLAHALEMQVTAEGVESPQALALLQVMGCDFVQGFFLSRPLPLEGLFRYVTDSSLRDRAPDEAITRFRQRVDAARNKGRQSR